MLRPLCPVCTGNPALLPECFLAEVNNRQPWHRGETQHFIVEKRLSNAVQPDFSIKSAALMIAELRGVKVLIFGRMNSSCKYCFLRSYYVQYTSKIIFQIICVLRLQYRCPFPSNI